MKTWSMEMEGMTRDELVTTLSKLVDEVIILRSRERKNMELIRMLKAAVRQASKP